MKEKFLKKLWKTAADKARRDNKFTAWLITALISLTSIAYLYSFYGFPFNMANKGLVDMGIMLEIIALTIMFLTVVFIVTYLSFALVRVIFDFIATQQGKKARKYLLPVLEDAYAELAKKRKELDSLYGLLGLKITYWNDLLSQEKLTCDPGFRNFAWKNSLKNEFLNLESFFQNKIDFRGESFPLIILSASLKNKIELLFQSEDDWRRQAISLAIAKAELWDYAYKASLELEDWFEEYHKIIRNEAAAKFLTAKL